MGCPALIARADSDYPVLYLTRPDGRYLAVVAMRLGDTWWFLWGKTGQAPAASPREAAATLTGRTPTSARDNVRALLRRRPQRRGGQSVTASARELAEVA